MNSNRYKGDATADRLNEFVIKVTGLQDKITRIATNQRAIHPLLQRTAKALRTMADSERRA